MSSRNIFNTDVSFLDGNFTFVGNVDAGSLWLNDTSNQLTLGAAGNTTIINGQGGNNTLNLPKINDTVVGRITADVLQNKSLESNCVLVDSTDTTKTIGWNLSGSTSNTELTFISSQTQNIGLTIPVLSGNDTICTLAASQTLSSKTLSSPTLSGTMACSSSPTIGSSSAYLNAIYSDTNYCNTLSTVSGSGNITVDNNLVPSGNGTLNLGSSSDYWKYAYLGTMYGSGGYVYTASNLMPSTTNNFALGSTSYVWNDIFVNYIISGAGNAMAVPTTGGNILSDTASQTLTNKTLSSPTLSGTMACSSSPTIGSNSAYLNAIYSATSYCNTLSTISGSGNITTDNNIISNTTSLTLGSSSSYFGSVYATTAYHDTLSPNVASYITIDDGIQLPTSGGTAATLNYYEEYNSTVTWSGPISGTSANIYIVRVGKLVSCILSGFNTSANGSGGSATTTAIVSRFRPSSNTPGWIIEIYTSNTNSVGILSLSTTGVFTATGLGGGSFSTSGTQAIQLNMGLTWTTQ